MATPIVALGRAPVRASRAIPTQHEAGAHNALTLALSYLRRGDLPAAQHKATQALASINALQQPEPDEAPAFPRFEGGERVRFNGQSHTLNDRVYAGQVGEVDFQCAPVAGVPGLVYVSIKAPGQRKARSVPFHHTSLEVVGHG